MEIQKLRNSRTWPARIAVSAGFLSFYLHGNIMHPLLYIPLPALFFALAAETRYKKSYTALLLPFSSGILCFLMKLFYWDKFDFAERVNCLLLLSLFFSAALAIKEFALLKKFTAYFNRLKLKKRLLAIFIFTELLFVVSAGIIVKKGVALGGDEPHYLAISQSLIKDFDLNVFNQYFREGYKEFIDVKQLRAHGAFGKGYKKMYSIHLPGVAVTIAPFLAFKIPLPWLYFLIRAYLGIFGALLAVVVYLFSLGL
ncbi:MAG: hypothetical protein L0Y73_02565, partial [Candidatus Aminicenantes bacterium]|nr:hypothetical protein [Candidatus Aminicenantes bacterium]